MLSNLQTRMITSIVLLAAAFLLFYLDSYPVTRYVISLIVFLAAWELIKICGYQKQRLTLLLMIFFAIFIINGLLHYSNEIFIIAPVFFLWIFILYVLLFRSGKFSFLKDEKIFFLASGFLILLAFFASTLYIASDWGIEVLFKLLVIIILADSLGYLVGKYLGKNMPFKRISPNKTVEGYVGSLFGTILILLLYSLSYSYEINSCFFNCGKEVLFSVVVIPAFILFSFLGDLYISVIKRHFNIDDTGTLLPGHGGILDRIDSYLPSFMFLAFLDLL